MSLRSATLLEIERAGRGELSLFHEACGREFRRVPDGADAAHFYCDPCRVAIRSDFWGLEAQAGIPTEAYARCCIDPDHKPDLGCWLRWGPDEHVIQIPKKTADEPPPPGEAP